MITVEYGRPKFIPPSDRTCKVCLDAFFGKGTVCDTCEPIFEKAKGNLIAAQKAYEYGLVKLMKETMRSPFVVRQLAVKGTQTCGRCFSKVGPEGCRRCT